MLLWCVTTEPLVPAILLSGLVSKLWVLPGVLKTSEPMLTVLFLLVPGGKNYS
jgi:hypothetical protein